MPTAPVSRFGSISVIDYRCNVGPADEPFTERHAAFSVSYVRSGSFGCRVGGRSLELVAGSILVRYGGGRGSRRRSERIPALKCLSSQAEIGAGADRRLASPAGAFNDCPS